VEDLVETAGIAPLEASPPSQAGGNPPEGGSETPAAPGLGGSRGVRRGARISQELAREIPSRELFDDDSYGIIKKINIGT
jgi:hypothetical protein